MITLKNYISESQTSTLKKASRREEHCGVTFYEIGMDTNGNPKWCVKKEELKMTPEQARSFGYRTNKIKDESGKTIEVWAFTSYSIPEDVELLQKEHLLK